MINSSSKLALYAVTIAMCALSIIFLILGEISDEYNIPLIVLPLAIGMLCLSSAGIDTIR